LLVADGGKRGGRRRVAEGKAQLNGRTDGRIGGGEGWHFAEVWKKFDGASNSFCSGFRGIHPVAAIVVAGPTNAPPVNTMDGPGTTAVWRLVDENLDAGRGKGGFVIVECPVELGFC
jgi:hypothetical protein